MVRQTGMDISFNLTAYQGREITLCQTVPSVLDWQYVGKETADNLWWEHKQCVRYTGQMAGPNNQHISMVQQKHVEQILLDVLDSSSEPVTRHGIFYQTKFSNFNRNFQFHRILNFNLKNIVVQFTYGHILALKVYQCVLRTAVNVSQLQLYRPQNTWSLVLWFLFFPKIQNNR